MEKKSVGLRRFSPVLEEVADIDINKKEFMKRCIEISKGINQTMSVHKDTEVKCCNCGFEYPLYYTEEYSKQEQHKRICFDCKEGLTE